MAARSVALVVISGKDEGQRAKTRVMWSRFATPRSLGDSQKENERVVWMRIFLVHSRNLFFYHFLDIFISHCNYTTPLSFIYLPHAARDFLSRLLDLYGIF